MASVFLAATTCVSGIEIHRWRVSLGTCCIDFFAALGRCILGMLAMAHATEQRQRSG
jgi:hypothetical protein